MSDISYRPILIAPVLVVLLAGQTAFAQTSADWTLTVNAVNVPFGQSDIHIHVQGPFNANKDVNIANGQNPSYSFNMNGADFPSGYQYKVCISATLVGLFLPHCAFFTHGDGDEAWNISPT